MREPAELIDIVTTGFEAAIVVGCLAMLRPLSRGLAMPRSARALALVAVMLAVVSLTTASLLSYDANHDTDEAQPEHQAP